MLKSFYIIDPTTNKSHCWYCGSLQFCELDQFGSCACCDCSPHVNVSLEEIESKDLVEVS